MRGAILTFAVLALGLWSASPAATAPWCLYTSSTGADCSYNTFQECTEAQSGVGGYCQRNSNEPVGAPSGARLGPPPGPPSDYMPPPPGLDPGAAAPVAPVPSNWCANESGGQNCGFPTYQACMADTSGVGGECVPAGR